ncbi:MAG: hypothetical protein ABSA78_17910 [Candidatus Sulfotelmatobacter sp.]
MSPLIRHPWWFCQEPNCSAPDRADDLQNRLWIRLWLQQLKGDPLNMRRLRDLLAKQILLPPSRVADNSIIEQVAELLTSGRLHIHAQKIETHPAGGVTASEDESVVAFPISQHQSRDPEPAPQFADPPSFPAKADLVAQAAALVGAAAAGTPFCPV